MVYTKGPYGVPTLRPKSLPDNYMDPLGWAMCMVLSVGFGFGVSGLGIGVQRVQLR